MNDQRFIGCLIALALWSGCQTEQKESTIDLTNLDLNTIDWQAHRGGKGLAPENTIPAFTYAVTLPFVKTLELDVVVSKDSILVVSHEPWMSSKICLTPDSSEISEAEEKQLNIFQMTLEQITAYDCGSKPVDGFPDQKKMKTSKPTLENVVKAVGAYAAQKNLAAPQFNIEIKSAPEGDNVYHPEPTVFAQLVIKAVNRLRIKERTSIQSFDVRALQAVHQQDSTLQLALFELLLQKAWSKIYKN
ncbi:MAG: glycerophosphodiester phosphodiesterase [Saprospiraceae bacterium]|nr:glycerophosphodiester phosphodiesterase [Saprospiraceae bacterium]